jgi:hypothetical protein
MVRAQVLIPRSLFRDLQRVARQERTSMAGIVRVAVRRHLESQMRIRRSPGRFDPICNLYDGAPDDSLRHDEIVYGVRERRGAGGHLRTTRPR